MEKHIELKQISRIMSDLHDIYITENLAESTHIYFYLPKLRTKLINFIKMYNSHKKMDISIIQLQETQKKFVTYQETIAFLANKFNTDINDNVAKEFDNYFSECNQFLENHIKSQLVDNIHKTNK